MRRAIKIIGIATVILCSQDSLSMGDGSAARTFDDEDAVVERDLVDSGAGEIDSQRAAIDWVVAQTRDSSSPYYGKLDETRIAIGGHSLGSVASFGNVADSRITASVHMAGGVTDNPRGVDNALIKTLRAPTLFLCGSADTNGLGAECATISLPHHRTSHCSSALWTESATPMRSTENTAGAGVGSWPPGCASASPVTPAPARSSWVTPASSAWVTGPA